MGQPFLVLTVFWLLGVALARYLPVDDWPLVPTAVSLFALGGLAFLAAFLLQRRHPRTYGRIALAVACIGFLLCGLGRAVLAQPTIDKTHIAFYNDREDVLSVTGLITDEPDIRDRSIQVRLAAESIQLESGSQPVGGDVLLILPRYPVIEYGTQVTLHGRVITPDENPDFSYRDYLALQGIYSQMVWPRTNIDAEYVGNPFFHILYAFKNYAHATINHLIPPPESGLLAGILLGIPHAMPPDLADDFRTTGITHIVVISGFNIAILSAIFVRLGDPLWGRKRAAVVAIIGIAVYTLLVGADPSVVRAGLMGGIYIIAHRALGRPNVALGSLFVAALIMTIYDPNYLWNIGFQLSFAATLSLMLFADPLTRWSHGRVAHLTNRTIANKTINLLSEAILITVAAQLLTLPLTMFYFQQVSLVSLLANAFILPAQPGVMIWGGLATLTGMLSTAVGQFFAWIAYLFLVYTTTMARFFAQVPYALVPIPFSFEALIATYLGLATLVWYNKQEPERRATLRQTMSRHLPVQLPLFASLLGVSLAGLWYSNLPDGHLHVDFLDVGQGDAILIQTPTGRQILVDGGYYPTVLLDGLGRHLPFWDRSLDVVVATHADADHVSGLPPVLERYEVGSLWVAETESESAVYQTLLDTAVAQNIPLYQPQRGETLLIEDGVRLEVVHPPAVMINEDRNANSLSLRLVYEDFSLLLTGDAEETGERAMLESGQPLEALVFKAGHHGANNASNAFFLEAVKPQVMVISSGVDNQFGHPHPDVLKRATAVGATVLRTDQLGTISLETDGERIWWLAETRP